MKLWLVVLLRQVVAQGARLDVLLHKGLVVLLHKWLVVLLHKWLVVLLHKWLVVLLHKGRAADAASHT